jgi:hypothetical protein
MSSLKRRLPRVSPIYIKVLYTCCPTSGANTANIASRITALSQVTAKDSGHFTAVGHVNLARNIGTGMHTLTGQRQASNRQK